MINILVLFLILRKLLFRPVMDIMEKRRQMIEGKLQEASREKEQAESLKREYEDIRGKAKEESRQIILQAKEEAQREARQLIEEAQKEARRQLEEAKASIEEKQTQALLDVKAQAAVLSMEEAKKLLENPQSSAYQEFIRKKEGRRYEKKWKNFSLCQGALGTGIEETDLEDIREILRENPKLKKVLEDPRVSDRTKAGG
nr:F0F1 ATP synthase subunit B [Suipraeoptans intestinalis]